MKPGVWRHSMWLIEDPLSEGKPELKDVFKDFRRSSSSAGKLTLQGDYEYDFCSSSYGRVGTREGFRLDRSRERVVLTARRIGDSSPHNNITYADDIFMLQLNVGEQGRELDVLAVNTESQSGKGCKIPVALGESSLVYHHRR